MKSKYIVFECPKGFETLIQFELVLKHSNIALQFGTPVSAGFITNGTCYGHSESLKLTARPEEDTRLLNRLKEGL